MKSDLAEAFDRLDWSNTEIDAIEKEIKEYLKTRPYNLRLESRHAELTSYKYVVLRNVRQLPAGIRLRAGTTTNEIRSILDSLASTLAKRNGRTPKGVYFPVADSELNYDNDKRIRDKIRKIANADKVLIRTLRPWKGGNDLLYALHGTDITRKHHGPIAILPAHGGFAIAGADIRSAKWFDFKFEEGAKIASLSPGSSVNLRILDIAPCYLEPPFLNGKEVVGVLRDFSSLVKQALELFN